MLGSARSVCGAFFFLLDNIWLETEIICPPGNGTRRQTEFNGMNLKSMSIDRLTSLRERVEAALGAKVIAFEAHPFRRWRSALKVNLRTWRSGNRGSQIPQS
jgi:hypothetical protein